MNQLPNSKNKKPSLTSKPINKNQSDEMKSLELNNYDIAIDYYSKGINNDKNNITFLIKRAICYLGKGFYSLALKDALKTIEIDSTFQKGYYIASLSYLEMYDFDNAEKYASNNNQRLLFLLDKKKKELSDKCEKYSIYPKYINFIKWLYKYDSYFPKLDIQIYSNDNRGVIAKCFIKKNEIIMTIPKACLISLEVALNTQIGRLIGKFMYSELNSPKHCLLSVFLLTEEKKDKWKFYFDFLPCDFSNFPIFYSDKELEYLKGSPFLTQIYQKKIEMKEDYDKICHYIPSFSQYSYLKFSQARMIIGSRIFGININNVKTDVLAPFADLLNHRRPRQTEWNYDDSLNAFVIKAIEDIQEGSEIFDSYGHKTNARLLINYGFALEDNDLGEYVFTIKLNKNYPLFDLKKTFFKNEYEYQRNFQLGTNIYESEIIEILSYLRFILFDGDINTLYKAMNVNQNFLEEDNQTAFFFISPISKELEIKVLKHFLFLLNDAMRKYPTTLEEDNIAKNDIKKKMSFNMRNCLYLVMSEKIILNYYIYFAEYCLGLFKMKEKEIMVKVNKDFKNKECQFVFYIQGVILKLIKV